MKILPGPGVVIGEAFGRPLSALSLVARDGVLGVSSQLTYLLQPHTTFNV